MQQNYPNLNVLQSTPLLYSTTFDKGTVKHLITWWGQHYGFIKTARMLDILKHVGFHQATLAGVSISIHDLHIPSEKQHVLQHAQNDIHLTSQKWQTGLITASERVQKALYTWTYANDLLKPGILHYFLSTNPFNPVYMMAFSGARGNISQVRQLIGMRGLMSNPKGTLIEFPITSNFREGLSISEYVISCYGARKGLVDTAIRTADAGYMTRRLVDVAHALVIRIADCETKKGIFLEALTLEDKIAVSLEKRSIGRVLAEDIYFRSRNDETESSYGAERALKDSKKQKLLLKRNSILTHRETDQLKNSILIRSPITCACQNALCQLCYGWSLCSNTIISLGEVVGIIAAQSIGEPGTQLTMRTFHTGGVFSGKSQSFIRAPRTGYLCIHPKPNTLATERTPFGDLGSEALPHTRIQIIDKNAKQSTSFSIPEGSILIIRDNEFVRYGQVIAMPPQKTKVLEDQEMTSEPIFAPISGEIGIQCFSNMKLCLPLATFSQNVQFASIPETQILQSDRYYFFNQNVKKNIRKDEHTFTKQLKSLHNEIYNELQSTSIEQKFSIATISFLEKLIDEINSVNEIHLLNNSITGVKNALVRRLNEEKKDTILITKKQIYQLSEKLIYKILQFQTVKNLAINEVLRLKLIQKVLTWHEFFYQTKKLSPSYSIWKVNLLHQLNKNNLNCKDSSLSLMKDTKILRPLKGPQNTHQSKYTARNIYEFPHYIINIGKNDFSFLKYPSFQFIITQAEYQEINTFGISLLDKIERNAIIQFNSNQNNREPRYLIETLNSCKKDEVNLGIDTSCISSPNLMSSVLSEKKFNSSIKNSFYDIKKNLTSYKINWTQRQLLQYPLYKFLTKFTNQFIYLQRTLILDTKLLRPSKNNRVKTDTYLLQNFHTEFTKQTKIIQRFGALGQRKNEVNFIIDLVGTNSRTQKVRSNFFNYLGMYGSSENRILTQKNWTQQKTINKKIWNTIYSPNSKNYFISQYSTRKENIQTFGTTNFLFPPKMYLSQNFISKVNFTEFSNKEKKSKRFILIGSLLACQIFSHLSPQNEWFSNFCHINIQPFMQTYHSFDSIVEKSGKIKILYNQIATLWNLRLVHGKKTFSTRTLSFRNRWIYFMKYSPIPTIISPSKTLYQKLNFGKSETRWVLGLKNYGISLCQFTNEKDITEFFKKFFFILQTNLPTTLATFYNHKIFVLEKGRTNKQTSLSESYHFYQKQAFSSAVNRKETLALKMKYLDFSYAEKTGYILKTNVFPKNKQYCLDDITKDQLIIPKFFGPKEKEQITKQFTKGDYSSQYNFPSIPSNAIKTQKSNSETGLNRTNYLLYLSSKNIKTYYTDIKTYYPLNISYRQGDSILFKKSQKAPKISQSGLLFAVHTLGISIRKATFTQIPLIKQYAPKVLFSTDQCILKKKFERELKNKQVEQKLNKIQKLFIPQSLKEICVTLGLTHLTKTEFAFICEHLITKLEKTETYLNKIELKQRFESILEKPYFQTSVICWHANTIEILVQKWVRQIKPHIFQSEQFIFAGDFLADLIYYKPTTSDIVQGLPKVESLFEGRKLVRVELALMFDFVKKIFMRYQNFGMIKFFVSQDNKVQFKSKRKISLFDKHLLYEQNSYIQYLNLLLKCTRKRKRKKQVHTTIFNHFIKNRARIKKSWKELSTKDEEFEKMKIESSNIRLLTSFTKPYVFRYPLRSIEKKLSHIRRFDLKKHGNLSSNIVFDFQKHSLKRKSLSKNIQIEGIRYSLVFLQTIQLFILENVQNVYFSQGVTIADKHIEVIIRQITSKVRVTLPGTSPISSGEIISHKKVEIANKMTIYQSQFIPYVLGMTQISLAAEGFISAASFQETKRVLIQSVIHGRVDFLNGLKENVILGHRLTIGNNTPLFKIPYQEQKKFSNKNKYSLEVKKGVLTNQLCTRIKLLLLTKFSN